MSNVLKSLYLQLINNYTYEKWNEAEQKLYIYYFLIINHFIV